GDVNQALMELGATLCAPKAPNCAVCPLTRECRSRSRDSLISTSQVRRMSFTDVVWPLAIVRCRGKILLRRRTTGKLLVRLWELPGGELKNRHDGLRVLCRELLDFPIKPHTLQRIGEIRHSITHRRIRAPIYLFDSSSHTLSARNPWRWILPEDAE